MDLQAIQQAIRDAGVDGWLFFDHHYRDPLAYHVLDLSPKAHRVAAMVLLHSRRRRGPETRPPDRVGPLGLATGARPRTRAGTNR